MRGSSLLATVFVLTLGACASGSGGENDPDAGKVDNPDAAGPPIDAPPMPIDASPIDATPMPIDAPPGTVPDTCAMAEDVTTEALTAGGATRTGNTTGLVNDVTTDSGCSGYTADGEDAIYAITVTAGQTITATATPSTAWDISLALVSPCQLTPTCHDGADSGFDGDPETVSFTGAPAGTYYLVVDSYNPGEVGAYSVNIRIQ